MDSIYRTTDSLDPGSEFSLATAREQEKRHFLDLLDQLKRSDDPAKQERLVAEFARLTFGG